MGKRAAEVSDLFLQASLDSSRWLEALDAMACATGSMRGQMLGVDRRGELIFNFATNTDQAFFDDFRTAVGLHDSHSNFRVAASMRAGPGRIVAEEDYDRVRSEIGCTAYEELCEKHGLPFGCQMALSDDGDALVGMALLRNRKEGRTTAEQRAFFDAVAPSARAAVRLQMMIEQRGAELTRGALDAVAAPALLVDGWGRVMIATPAAEKMLAATRRIDVRNRVVTAASPMHMRDIQSALAGVLFHGRPEATLLLRGGGEPPLSLSIQALPRSEWGMGFCPCAIIVLKGGGAEPNDLRKALRIEFGLTASEIEVALALAGGRPRSEVAETRGTSIGTVRQQVKAIFAKLGVSREGEFMALIASFQRG